MTPHAKFGVKSHFNTFLISESKLNQCYCAGNGVDGTLSGMKIRDGEKWWMRKRKLVITWRIVNSKHNLTRLWAILVDWSGATSDEAERETGAGGEEERSTLLPIIIAAHSRSFSPRPDTSGTGSLTCHWFESVRTLSSSEGNYNPMITSVPTLIGANSTFLDFTQALINDNDRTCPSSLHLFP